MEFFYEDNIDDIRVAYIEKARIRLKKLLMYDIETINRIENSKNANENIIKNTEKSSKSQSGYKVKAGGKNAAAAENLEKNSMMNSMLNKSKMGGGGSKAGTIKGSKASSLPKNHFMKPLERDQGKGGLYASGDDE
ncbi:MAG: hypothetical protein MJ252_11095 [archaeon]|nr:hypothetical protein [archaeon]